MPQLENGSVGEVEEIHFADYSSLRRHVTGDWSEYGASRLIQRAEVDQFGDLTNNQQWIHVDDARCRDESPYGNVIVHGLFLLALVPALLPPESFRVVGHNQRIVRGCERFRFPAPVYPEESIRVRSRLLSVSPAHSGKGTVVSRSLEMQVEDRETPVLTAELLLQYF